MKLISIAYLRYLVFAFILCAVSSLRGQNLYAIKIDRKIRQEAMNITAQYQPRLVMGSEQALQFQITVAKFLVKKNAVLQDPTLTPKAQYDLLKRLSSRETSEMADVLESFRWKEYMRIKSFIQPLPQPHVFGEDIAVRE